LPEKGGNAAIKIVRRPPATDRRKQSGPAAHCGKAAAFATAENIATGLAPGSDATISSSID
jgi:hypothetical protein